MKVFFKVLFLVRGIILLWERRRVLYAWSRTGGSRLWSTWWELWRISAKSLESAASQSSIIIGWVGDSKPCFFIFVSRAWSRCLQPSPSIPHQAGLAYTILDKMVALVTSHRWVPLSPWAISVLTAYKLWLLWVKILSTWARKVKSSFYVTPRIFIVLMCSIPGAGSGMSPNLVLGRLTIISFVLRTFSFKLLSWAHCSMCASSEEIREAWFGGTIR